MARTDRRTSSCERQGRPGRPRAGDAVASRRCVIAAALTNGPGSSVLSVVAATPAGGGRSREGEPRSHKQQDQPQRERRARRNCRLAGRARMVGSRQGKQRALGGHSRRVAGLITARPGLIAATPGLIAAAPGLIAGARCLVDPPHGSAGQRRAERGRSGVRPLTAPRGGDRLAILVERAIGRTAATPCGNCRWRGEREC